MASEYVKNMQALARAVKSLTGLDVVWKNASGMGEEGLPRGVYEHCNAYCREVKRDARAVQLCVRDDCRRTALKACRLRKPFIKSCHAGVVELVLPLMDGARFDGVLFVGPMRKPGSKPSRGIGKAAMDCFAAMPLLDKKKLSACEALLWPALSAWINRREMDKLRKRRPLIKNPRIASALEVVNARFAEPISAASVAGLCHLSPSRFVHAFKEATGVPFSDYLAGLRVARAKLLLQNAELPVATVAAQAGFGTQGYFARFFRRWTGQTPSEYRLGQKRTAHP